MKVTCQHDEEAGTYAIGATIDGVFVPFYTLPASQVDATVEAGKNAQDGNGSQES